MDKLRHFGLKEKVALCLEPTSSECVLTMDSQSCNECGRNARLAATSSDFSFRLYSRESLGADVSISGHEKKITGVKFSNKNPNLVFSSSHDKSVKSWDFRASVEKPAQTFAGHEETNIQLNCLDLSCDDRVLCSGTEADKEGDSFLIFWDSRKSAALGVYSESHENDVTQVKFHPEKRDYLASSSTDGLVCLFDVSQPSEEDALYGTLNSESSVAEIGWCGNQLQNIYCTTHIDTLLVWDSDEFDVLDNFTDLKEDLKRTFDGEVDYIVNCFHSEGSENLYLLAGTHKGCLHLFEVQNHEVFYLSSLEAGHRDDVRCLSWDEQTSSLVTGGDDAMLCLWGQGAARETEAKYKAKAASKLKRRRPEPSKKY